MVQSSFASMVSSFSIAIAVTGALALAGCGPKGSKVEVLHVEDEVVGPTVPTVAGGVELTFAAADGVTIAGTYWAPKDGGEKACVLMAHQLSSTRAEYGPVVTKLIGQAHVYAIDLRGHGASTTGPAGEVGWKGFETADWEKVEIDLVGALDVLRGKGAGEKCVVIGASIGSSATLRMAGAHPERVKGVVLLSPGLGYRGLATPEAARNVKAPVLIVHSQDKGAADAATALAQIFEDSAVEAEVIADPGQAHGMKIVAGDEAVLEQVVGFVRATMR